MNKNIQTTEDETANNTKAASLTSQDGSLLGWIGLRVRALFSVVKVQRTNRRLRLCETLSLGEKRIVAVVEFEGQRFLLAATPQNISLLQPLGPGSNGAEEKQRT